jgi:site-specific DNA recombinase
VKKAALYLRRSTEKQDRSIADQDTVCRRYAAETDHQIVAVYVDDALSGTTIKGRLDFQQLLRDGLSPSPAFEDIIACDYSRYSRTDPAETFHYIHLLNKNGVDLVSATETTPKGSVGMLFKMFSYWKAHQECVDISMKTLRGLASRAADGFWNGGVPPYGYDTEYCNASGTVYMRVRYYPGGNGGYKREILDGSGSRVRVLVKGERIPASDTDPCHLVLSLPERVEVVILIFRMYTERGMGFKAIVEALNARGIRSPRGGRWSVGTVRAIIKNRVYVGDLVWNMSAQGKFHRLSRGKAEERPRTEYDKHCWNEEKDWVVSENAHPAIVDKKTFGKAQRILRERGEIRKVTSQPSGRGKQSPYLLTGKVICKRCGKHCHGHRPTKGKRRKDGTRVATEYYVCNSYTDGNRSLCPDSLYKREPLERGVVSLVAKRVNAILSNGGIDGLLVLVEREICAEVPDVGAEVTEITSKLGEINDRIDTLLDSLTPINKEFVDGKLVGLKGQKESLETRLSELQSIDEEEVDCRAIAEQIMATVNRFEDLFPYGTIEEQKEFIGLFFDRVELDPDTRVGEVYMRRFPMPVQDIGKSFGLVAGARYTPTT